MQCKQNVCVIKKMFCTIWKDVCDNLTKMFACFKNNVCDIFRKCLYNVSHSWKNASYQLKNGQRVFEKLFKAYSEKNIKNIYLKILIMYLKMLKV